MKGKVLGISLAAVVLLAALALLWPGAVVRAQPAAPMDWSNVQVVTYGNGVTGFFDRNTGTLFLYDGQLRRPVLIRQIDVLGRPLKTILD